MSALRLSDSELDCVMKAARPIDAAARDQFLQQVAAALKGYGELGDGVGSFGRSAGLGT